MLLILGCHEPEKRVENNRNVCNLTREKFISITLKNFCNKKNIIIGYIIPYINKKNRITE